MKYVLFSYCNLYNFLAWIIYQNTCDIQLMCSQVKENKHLINYPEPQFAIFPNINKRHWLKSKVGVSLNLSLSDPEYTIYWTWDKVKLLPWVCHVLRFSNDSNSFWLQDLAITGSSFKVQNSMLFCLVSRQLILHNLLSGFCQTWKYFRS